MDGHNPDQDTSFSGVLKRVISPISDAIIISVEEIFFKKPLLQEKVHLFSAF
jgi:hypothetical protein